MQLPHECPDAETVPDHQQCIHQGCHRVDLLTSAQSDARAVLVSFIRRKRAAWKDPERIANYRLAVAPSLQVAGDEMRVRYELAQKLEGASLPGGCIMRLD